LESIALGTSTTSPAGLINQFAVHRSTHIEQKHYLRCSIHSLGRDKYWNIITDIGIKRNIHPQ